MTRRPVRVGPRPGVAIRQMEVDHVQESSPDPPIRFAGEMTVGDEVPHIGVGSDGMGAQYGILSPVRSGSKAL